tara:strand:+ start:93 stop:1019 length:927 start_codon:yes stop_codon:yes gene_type:complete
MQVVYAHTDSLYVPIPSIEKAKEIRGILNKYIQDEIFPNLMGLDDHPMDLEFEKYYSVLGVGATRNRNAGFINWKDGVHLNEPEFVSTGFAMKRIAESKIGKEVQKTTVEMWINLKPKEEIIAYTKSMYNNIRLGLVDKLDLVKRSRVKENRLKLKCKCKKVYSVDYVRKVLGIVPDSLCEKDNCNSYLKDCTTVEGKRPVFGGGFAGMLYYNEHVKPKDKIDDSFYHFKAKFNSNQIGVFTNWNGDSRRAEYIAVKTLDEFGPYEPDWNFLAESEVMKKIKPVFEAMSWDLDIVKKDDRQKDLGEWF